VDELVSLDSEEFEQYKFGDKGKSNKTSVNNNLDLEKYIISTKSSLLSKAKSESEISFESFKVLKLLGTGSFGDVYLVEKKDTGKSFAMKVLNKSKIMGK
jgi:hypothetical protein